LKPNAFLTLHAFIDIAAGIAFALYSPLAVNLLGVPGVTGSADLYWFMVSFARLFGATLFGWGFLILSLRKIVVSQGIDASARQGVLVALLLGNLVSLIVVLTQQISIWGTTGGWVITGVFFILLASCVYYLIKKPGF
jgi:hypothetical protein